MERMTAEELAGLEAAAEKTQHGVWFPSANGLGVQFGRLGGFSLPKDMPLAQELVDYILTANPSTVLRLVEQAGRVEWLEKVILAYADPHNWAMDEAGIARQWVEPESATPTSYAGFELACKATSDMQSALRAEPASQLDAPAPPEVAVEQEPVAWMSSDREECVTAKSKVKMENAGFGVWDLVAAKHTIPLYASPAVPVAAGLPASDDRAEITRLDIMSLIRQQYHRVYASAIDREEVDTKYMAEIEDALRNYSKNSSGSPTAPAGFDERESFIWSLGYMAGKDSPAPALPVVPEGMALVPVEPTRLMLNAIWGKSSQLDLPDAYAAMLAAAATPVLSAEQPSQPQDQSGGIRPSAEPAGKLCFTDEEIERASLMHIATQFERHGNGQNYRDTAQFARHKAFAQELASGFREGRNAQPESSPIAEPDTATQAPSESTESDAARWKFFCDNAQSTVGSLRLHAWLAFDGVMEHGSHNAAIDSLMARATQSHLKGD